MNLGQKVRIDGRHRGTVVAYAADVGATVRFERDSLARIKDANDVKYLRSTGGHAFFEPGQFNRLEVIA